MQVRGFAAAAAAAATAGAAAATTAAQPSSSIAATMGHCQWLTSVWESGPVKYFLRIESWAMCG
jgi:hypothetical protein